MSRHKLTPEERTRAGVATSLAPRVRALINSMPQAMPPLIGPRVSDMADQAAVVEGIRRGFLLDVDVGMGGVVRLTVTAAGRHWAKRKPHKGHKLTHADRSRGGRTTAAKRKAQRTRDLITLALGRGETATAEEAAATAPEFYSAVTREPLPAKRETEAPSSKSAFPPGTTIGYRIEGEFPGSEAQALMDTGASLAGKLMEGPRFTQPGPMGGPMSAPIARPPPAIDPFTLSALRRFRLGPKSPLSLTRSQQAQVALLREQGLIEADGESMLRLTSKGREAIENATPEE